MKNKLKGVKMQINPISYGYNTNFEATARANLKFGPNATAKVDVIHNEAGKIKQITIELWKNQKMLQKAENFWEKGTTYDYIQDSHYLQAVCNKLGLLDKLDQEQISDAIFEANMDEYSKTNDTDTVNSKILSSSPAPWSGADPNDSYVDVYPYGNSLGYED